MALTKLSVSDAALLANEITPRLADAVASRIKIAMALGDDALLTSREAADFLNKSRSTLEIWRAKGFGPRWIRTGSRAAWISDRRSESLFAARRVRVACRRRIKQAASSVS